MVLEKLRENLWRLVVGPLKVNTYILVGRGECIIVDPGECRAVVATLASLGCRSGLVLVTHGHFDHVAGVACLSRGGYKVAGHPLASTWALEFASWARGMGINVDVEPFNIDIELGDGSTIEFGGAMLRVMHTPGHSPDHLVYIDHGMKVAFTGDLIFRGSIGRDDIPGGSPQELGRSLSRLLRVLDLEYLLLPGHGPETTLREELETNYLLRLYASRGTHNA